ncbi:MAG: hybrid sensor histidine kinase/response regulator [Prevotella sp.]|nr:hybrid sensor histidine kinase/response regulator [Prevotella sp.]
MQKNHFPFKVAAGYCAVAAVLILAISLVYSNTKSILAINQASREYIQKRDAADSTMSALLKEEQANLHQLSAALEGKGDKNYLREKVNSLNNGKDSIVVHPKTQQTHKAQNTTVEVVKTRKGFFRRLADAFKKEHAETLSVKRDSNNAIIDSITTPVNVAENVADILEQIDRKEKSSSKNHSQAISKEMENLQMVNAQLALRSAQQLNEVHQRERDSMQQAINKAMEARQYLLWQIGLLAVVAIIAAIILLWYIWRDTQKERIYRENLENANEEIRRIMQQREHLLLTITHDIKAPAASISGFIDLMKDYVSDARGTECLVNIKRSAHHLSHLVAALLDYHQLENGLMKVHSTDFSPKELVAESVEGMRVQAESKGLKISYEIKEKEHNALYNADAFRIRQILDNLISNAIKYTDKGSIMVSMSIRQKRNAYNIIENKNAYLLTLDVTDTGKGMTTEERQKVFQAFTRLKNAQGIEGTGLGLSITHELATLLGGEIHVKSEVGKGSTFTATIPIELADTSQTKVCHSHNELDEKPSEDAPKTSPSSTEKLLILDDDKLQLQLLQEMLRRLAGDSWQVFACNHVTDALTLLHNEQPAIMLMDIEMPEMSGKDLIKHINHNNMKVIAMTAHDTSIKEELREAGFDDCLFKPFSQESLQKVLHLASEKKSRGFSKKVPRFLKKSPEVFGNTSEGSSDGIDNQPIHPRLQPLLAFAGDDEEAAQEIITTVKQELESHLHLLQEVLLQIPMETASSIATIDSSLANNIAKTAHKLLPIASMMQMDCLPQLTALSPEHIQEQEAQKIREYVQAAINDLQHILGEILSV